MAMFMVESTDISSMPVLTLPENDPPGARQGQLIGLLLEILDGSAQPFVIADASGLIAGCNSAFCRLVGYSRDELFLRHVADLTPVEWREKESAIIAGQIRSKMPAIYQKEYVRKGGARIHVELYDHAIYDKAGHPLYFYAFVTDVTGRQNR